MQTPKEQLKGLDRSLYVARMAGKMTLTNPAVELALDVAGKTRDLLAGLVEEVEQLKKGSNGNGTR
jgi:hypothetical protein